MVLSARKWISHAYRHVHVLRTTKGVRVSFVLAMKVTLAFRGLLPYFIAMYLEFRMRIYLLIAIWKSLTVVLYWRLLL